MPKCLGENLWPSETGHSPCPHRCRHSLAVRETDSYLSRTHEMHHQVCDAEESLVWDVAAQISSVDQPDMAHMGSQGSRAVARDEHKPRCHVSRSLIEVDDEDDEDNENATSIIQLPSTPGFASVLSSSSTSRLLQLVICIVVFSSLAIPGLVVLLDQLAGSEAAANGAVRPAHALPGGAISSSEGAAVLTQEERSSCPAPDYEMLQQLGLLSCALLDPSDSRRCASLARSATARQRDCAEHCGVFCQGFSLVAGEGCWLYSRALDGPNQQVDGEATAAEGADAGGGLLQRAAAHEPEGRAGAGVDTGPDKEFGADDTALDDGLKYDNWAPDSSRERRQSSISTSASSRSPSDVVDVITDVLHEARQRSRICRRKVARLRGLEHEASSGSRGRAENTAQDT